MLPWLEAGNRKQLDDDQDYPEAALAWQQVSRQNTEPRLLGCCETPEQDPAAPRGAARRARRQAGSSPARSAHAYCFNGIFQHTSCPGDGKGSSPAASQGWGECVQLM